MKVLVISDSHGNINHAVLVINKIKSLGLGAVLHLGDHAEDAARLKVLYPDLRVESVYGNCDGMCYREEGTKVVFIEEVPLFMTHGHRHKVKWGDYEELFIDAAAHEVKAALCGHSHIAYLGKKEGIILLNPGSISLPRDSSYPSYGILTIEKGSIKEVAVMQIVDREVICRHPVNNQFRYQ